MTFEDELNAILPADLPNRDALVVKGALHLERIVDANRNFNLTRILNPQEAAIKHVLDSVLPWKHFQAAHSVLDAGTGAGFPGIPLAIVLPACRFVLSESIQKKARFVQSATGELSLANVEVSSQRAEEILRVRRFDLLTARAVAPLPRALDLFGPKMPRALFYKGPDVESEIQASPRRGVRIVERYELPHGYGTRTIVEVSPRS